MLYNLETDALRKRYFKQSFLFYNNIDKLTIFTGFSKITLNSLSDNCSIVFLTGVNWNFGTTDTQMKEMMRRIVNWARLAKYTKFFFSSNGGAWMDPGRHKLFIETFNFKPLHEPYKSRRTSNQITWYQADILELDKLLKGETK